MSARRVVYTTLVNHYEALLEQPVAAGHGIDLVCLTDDATLTSETWSIRVLPRALPADPVRSSRRMKILAHEYLTDFDESVYIDNSVLLTAPAPAVFDVMLPEGVALGVISHSYRGPVRDEFLAVLADRLETRFICDEQKLAYEEMDPASLDAQTLWSGILGRRHHDPVVQSTMKSWWEQVLRYSRRDQLSLPHVLRHSSLRPMVQRFDNFTSSFHEWPRWSSEPKRSGRMMPLGAAEIEIADLLRRVERSESSIDELILIRDDRDAIVLGLEALFAERDGISSERDSLVDERIALLIERDRLICAAGKVQGDLRALEAQRDALRTQIAELEGSTSWRMTRPIRTLSRLILRRSEEDVIRTT